MLKTDPLNANIQLLGERLCQRGLQLATAESCTGGGIGAVLTQVPGSSQWYRGGVIAYCNAIKQQMLGVDAALLQRHGAVSQAVVKAMALGACQCCGAQLAVSVSGVAGPGGGSSTKPVGQVWLAWASNVGTVTSRRFQFDGDRQAVRHAAVAAAISGLLDWLAD